jgi:hypothetical protein
MQKSLALSAFALFLALVGCDPKGSTNYADQADCTNVNASTNTYANSIKAILDTRCATAGCHNATTKEDDIDLSAYAVAKEVFQTRDALCAIHHGDGCEPMPKGSLQLDDATINLIDCWVKNGYQE